MDPAKRLTELVNRVSRGDQRADDELLPLLYEELHALARRHMSGERPGHTLRPTELVHETYLRLVRIEGARWTSRGHFFKAASTAMRRLLVDHARRRKSARDGGEHLRAALEDEGGEAVETERDVLRLDEALVLLEEIDEELAQLVQLRFFGGLSMEETADTIGRSLRTTERRWRAARLWLRERLDG
ncbi:MAG: ECF-type sigma factor [Planctomycetota bacterium]